MLRVLFSYGFPCVSRKMNTKSTPSRRVEENEVIEEIPPQVEEVYQVTQGDHVPIVEGSNDIPVVTS